MIPPTRVKELLGVLTVQSSNSQHAYGDKKVHNLRVITLNVHFRDKKTHYFK